MKARYLILPVVFLAAVWFLNRPTDHGPPITGAPQVVYTPVEPSAEQQTEINSASIVNAIQVPLLTGTNTIG